MPTILRFRGFRIMIFVEDHEPAHVHAFHKDADLSYWLNCPAGAVTTRYIRGKISPAEARALEAFLNDNLIRLCEAWESIDDLR